ncbi:MAG: hypothetical protein HZA46_19690 [Planctomycetales bacterium]|nr:hypothetical protein [Planctomycetales bacterium]
MSLQFRNSNRVLLAIAFGGSVLFWINRSRSERTLEFSIESYECPAPGERNPMWIANVRMKNITRSPVKFWGIGKEHPISELEVQTNDKWIDQSLIGMCGMGLAEQTLLPGESVCFREVLFKTSHFVDGALLSAPRASSIRNWRVGVRCYHTNWAKYLPSVAQAALSRLPWNVSTERSYVCWSDPIPHRGQFVDAEDFDWSAGDDVLLETVGEETASTASSDKPD